MMKPTYRLAACLLTVSLLSGILAGCGSGGTASNSVSSSAPPALKKSSWETAKSAPFSPYPQTVTYTLGKMCSGNNSNMPAGSTYENNAYTRYLKKKLNIQNKDTFEVTDSDNYEAEVELSVANQDLPDVMLVNSRKFLITMIQNDLVANLTDAFKHCASPRLREIYNSYDGLIDSVTFNGKIMALPETDVYSGPNFLWLRKDWMDKLGLSAPKTLADAKRIIQAFVEKDPGKNGLGNNVGLVCDSDLVGNPSTCYSLDPLFAQFDSYPKKWIQDKSGGKVYGSVTQNTRKALALLHEWYRDGIIDPDFMLRTNDNAAALVAAGKTGALFGWWWAPNNPLIQSMQKNPSAQWVPYLLPTGSDGTVRVCLPAASPKYIVVRKNYNHPEIVMKIMSTLYDYARYQDPAVSELQTYFSENVDPTATPLVLNCDYSDAVTRTTNHILSVLNGSSPQTSLNMVERAYYKSCNTYLSQKVKQPTSWAAFTSRITAVKLLLNNKVTYVNKQTSATNTAIPSELAELEKEAFLNIIIGNQPITYFDTFVQRWYDMGGEKLTQQENQQ